MSNESNLLTPVGRLVGGSLYLPQTKDMDGNLLVWKTGNMQGQPRSNFWFAVAIRKNGEQHWSQIQPVMGANGKFNGTDWARVIWSIAHAGFPNNPPGENKKFAWKIIDGDSTETNIKGKKPCEYEGYPGHWVLSFSSSYAPGILNADGTKQIVEPNFVNLGDFIQVFGSVAPNGKQTTPGVFLNHKHVAFAAYGERIKYSGIDPEEIGFGGGALPQGASAVPLNQGFSPAAAQPPATYAHPAPPPVVPHTGILTPPPPPPPPPPVVAPKHVMLPAANNVPYEAYIAGGWTDALLIQLGYMAP